jgi:hypothetical protein
MFALFVVLDSKPSTLSQCARVALRRNQKSTIVDRAILRDTSGNKRQIKHDIYNKLAITSSPTFSSVGPITPNVAVIFTAARRTRITDFRPIGSTCPGLFPVQPPGASPHPLTLRVVSWSRRGNIARPAKRNPSSPREVGAAIKGASLKGASLYAPGAVCGEVCARIFRDSRAHFSRGKFKGVESRSSASPRQEWKIRDVRLSRAAKNGRAEDIRQVGSLARVNACTPVRELSMLQLRDRVTGSVYRVHAIERDRAEECSREKMSIRRRGA